jgi:thiamine-monophosphate kinase
MSELPEEFAMIATHFAPLAGDGALNLSDDAAIFTPPPNRELVISADAIVETIHFLPTDPPDLVARKLLRVNLSDLAAMGATPLSYLLTVSVPRTTPKTWFAAFAAGLATDQQAFNIHLLGGDTTSTPGPSSLSATIIGHVARGTALRRTGAQPGDSLWVTGTIGDAALGLLALQGQIDDPTGHLSGRYQLPRPRLGLSLHGIVHACMDVSDGLLQDAAHLARAANLTAEIDTARIPLSPAARAAENLQLCLTGGDDYELLLAVPPSSEPALLAGCAASAIPITRIGHVLAGPPELRLLDPHGKLQSHAPHGWSHF